MRDGVRSRPGTTIPHVINMSYPRERHWLPQATYQVLESPDWDILIGPDPFEDIHPRAKDSVGICVHGKSMVTITL